MKWLDRPGMKERAAEYIQLVVDLWHGQWRNHVCMNCEAVIDGHADLNDLCFDCYRWLKEAYWQTRVDLIRRFFPGKTDEEIMEWAREAQINVQHFDRPREVKNIPTTLRTWKDYL